jgi:hypothetical protein
MERVLVSIFILFCSFLSANAQMVGTPYMPFVSTDRIRSALAIAGCTSCTAYDAAASNTLVPITLAEYNAILTNVTGASKKGYLGSMAGTYTAFGILGGTNKAAPGTVDLLAANSYIAAVAYQTYSNSTAHIQITASPTFNGIATCLTTASAAISWTAGVTRYFAVKRPTTHSGTNTFVGHRPVGTIYGTYVATSVGGCSYNTINCGGSPTNAHPYTIGLQVIATTTKPWQ